MDTPVSLQVVPQQVLKDQQAVILEDATKNVSGVQRVWNGEGFGQDLSFAVLGHAMQDSPRTTDCRFNTDMANVEQVEC